MQRVSIYRVLFAGAFLAQASCTADPIMTPIASAIAPVAPASDPDLRPYPEVSFAATHNSYCGDLGGGDVASIVTQLDRGVRMLELDVHDDDFESEGFTIGHTSSGSDVFHGDGNPSTDRLEDWLALIAEWSDANPTHAPITLLLDLKDTLSDNASYEDGDLIALNELLERRLGAKLFAAHRVETRKWPSVGELRGRILVVLSGSESSRIAYRGDRATKPAIAMNDDGVVIEAHGTNDGELWYWAGRYQTDGTVRWLRHAKYDNGKMPAIDLNNDGYVIEVHQDPDQGDDQLWYRVGRIDESYEIQWMHDDGLEFPQDDDGVAPSVRFASRSSNELTEIHKSPNTGLNWYWKGAIDVEKKRVKWTRESSGRTREQRFLRHTASSKRGTVEAFTGRDGAFGSDTLLYSTDRAGPLRIRPPQLAFVEVQHDSSTQLENDGLLFYSGPAASLQARVWAVTGRAAGKISRLWSFNDQSLTNEASVNFPATDLPFSKWYDGYRRALETVR